MIKIDLKKLSLNLKKLLVQEKQEKEFQPSNKKQDLKTISLVTIVIGLMIIYFNIQFFIDSPELFSLINLLAIVVILGIPLIAKYYDFSRMKKIESQFPKFMRDVTQSIKTGMTLPQAMRAASSNQYDTLTPYVQEMKAKISWGVPFEKVLKDFAEKVGSESLKRTVQTIIEAHRSGGTIETVMEAIVDSLSELEKIKKERSASLYSQMINGYLIYVVFLGVMIGMSAFLIPSFQFGEVESDLPVVFNELFRSLIIIQGFFAGIAIGKMAEGTVVAGVKHSLVMVLFGYSVFLLFA